MATGILVVFATLACSAITGPASAQAQAIHDRTISVTGTSRVQVEPDQAVLSLGATIQRGEAREAQGQLDAVVERAVSSIREVGIDPLHIQTADLSLQPVYAEQQDSAAATDERHGDPRVVAYRATNIVRVTILDIAMVGAVVDAGTAAGINEIRELAFGLANDLPYRVTALERAVEAARQKAQAAAAAIGVRLGQPLEVRERSVATPYAGGATFARAEAAAPIAPGEITIDVTVDATFRLD